jgi:hypothetical protein
VLVQPTAEGIAILVERILGQRVEPEILDEIPAKLAVLPTPTRPPADPNARGPVATLCCSLSLPVRGQRVATEPVA